MPNPTTEYARKRNFNITSEPRDDIDSRSQSDPAQPLFVVQKHHARNLHYDFRLELGGTLKSWAVPKGPSLDPKVKRLAVHVEDHPLAYATFEGTIPEGEYGAGHVIVWDTGSWEPLSDPAEGYKNGKLKFVLHGEKLGGTWNLIRTRFKDSKKDHWLLIKEDDQEAKDADKFDVLTALPDAVSKRQHPDREAKAKAALSGVFPMSLKPQLASMRDAAVLQNGQWLYEIKFDGYRILARIQQGDVRLLTRNGHDWTSRLPTLAASIADLGLTESWLDGELVALDREGIPDFQALQNSLEAGRSDDLVYFVFDAPWLDGEDLRKHSLTARRDAVEAWINKSPNANLRFSTAFTEHDWQSVLSSACNMSLEGIIAKRTDALYQSRRTDDWVKLKCRLRQEFVIVGYTDPQGSRKGLGSLLLAVHQAPGGSLQYCGRVGTGFDDRQLDQLIRRLQPLQVNRAPLAERPPALPASTAVNWVEPQQVCEVEFSQWTKHGLVRHAVFIGLRDDKPATEIIREVSNVRNHSADSATKQLADNNTTGASAKRKGSGTKPTAKTNQLASKARDLTNRIAGVPISSAERIIDPESGFSKIELAAFYASLGDWLLPHLRRRPVSLVRAPEGIKGEQFFQKHAPQFTIPHVTLLDQQLDPGHAPLLEVSTARALAGAVQMGTIEFHTWGAMTDRIERPDRITLDLDPDPKLPWSAMVDATRLVVTLLEELGLQCYLKTSGGKGIHIIIAIARTLSWDEVKSFAKAISRFMARQLPDQFADKMGPKNRIGKIFIDYLRNSRGASTVAAYSVRARPGLPVSVPIGHDELDRIEGAAEWTVRNLPARLSGMKKDPWHDYSNRQRINKDMFHRLGMPDN